MSGLSTVIVAFGVGMVLLLGYMVGAAMSLWTFFGIPISLRGIK